MISITGLEALAEYSLEELDAISAIEELGQVHKAYIYIKPIQIPIDPIKKLKAQRSLELEREKLTVYIKKSMTIEELKGSPERVRHLSKRLLALEAKQSFVFEKIPLSGERLRRKPKIQACSQNDFSQAR